MDQALVGVGEGILVINYASKAPYSGNVPITDVLIESSCSTKYVKHVEYVHSIN